MKDGETLYRIELATPVSEGVRIDYDAAVTLDQDDFDPRENLDELVDLLVSKGVLSEDEVAAFIETRMKAYQAECDQQHEERQQLIDKNKYEMISWARNQYRVEKLKVWIQLLSAFTLLAAAFWLFFILSNRLPTVHYSYAVGLSVLGMFVLRSTIRDYKRHMLIIRAVEKGPTDEDVLVWYAQRRPSKKEAG